MIYIAKFGKNIKNSYFCSNFLLRCCSKIWYQSFFTMLERHIFGPMNQDASDAGIKPTETREAWNTYIGINGELFREAMKGFQSLAVTLPSGTNKCVGAWQDTVKNRMIFLLYNSNGNHGIYSFKPESNIVEKKFEWQGLGLSPDILMNGAAIVGDLFYFCYNGKIRVINLNRAYSNIKEAHISLIKQPPTSPPSIQKEEDLSRIINNIGSKNFQFAYKYIYIDGEESVWSPKSKLLPALFNPVFQGSYNRVKITFQISPNVQGAVKRIDIAYSEGNEEDYFVFDSIENPINNSYAVYFYNDKAASPIAEIEVAKPFENIPTVSKTLAFYGDRLFLTKNEIGFPVNLSGSFTVQAVAEEPIVDETIKKYKYCKGGGMYNVGIVYYDDNLRSMGVLYKAQVSIPQLGVIDSFNIASPYYYIQWQLNNITPPSWATSYQIVCTDEQFYSVYFQTHAMILYYIKDKEANDVLRDSEIELSGRIYLKNKPETASDYSYMHILMPTNMPVVADTEFFVKIMGSTLKSENVIEVLADGTIVVRDFGISDYVSFSESVFIEVFKPAKKVESIFYEIGERFSILNPGTASRQHATTSGKIYGDTYEVNYAVFFDYKFKSLPSGIATVPWLKDFIDKFNGTPSYIKSFPQLYIKVESPSPTFTSTVDTNDVQDTAQSSSVDSNIRNLEEAINKTEKGNAWDYGFNVVDMISDYASKKQRKKRLKKLKATKRDFSLKRGYVLDYLKADGDYGRPQIEFKEKKQYFRPNTYVFSNPYSQSLNINGLSNFDFDSEYTLGVEVGDVVKSVAISSGIISVHPNCLVSLYIGEGILRSGEDSLTAKVEGVIGDDRKLIKTLGSIHPESIVLGKNDYIYGFDIHRGEPWRYASNGQIELGTDYNMQSYFKRKAEQLLPYKDSIKIIGGYHPVYEMYLITFPAIGNIPAETVGFSEKIKGWLSFYSFAPEAYGYVGNKMFSFKNGVPYVHDQTLEYNNFYGTVYDSSVKFTSNAQYPNEKMFQSIAVQGLGQWDMPEAETPNNQLTDLVVNDFEKKDNVAYADFLRDKNTPAAFLKPGQLAIRDGSEIKDKSLTITLRKTGGSYGKLESCNVSFIIVPGHTNA